MKHYFFLFSFLVIFLSSCVVVVDSTNSFQDELYYSASEYSEQDKKDELAYQKYLEDQQSNTDTVYEEELYLVNDYYDKHYYDYNSRIKMFYGTSFGFHNNYYTNFFGVGYSYNPYYGWSNSYHGWNSWYLDPWYSYHFSLGYNHYPFGYNYHDWMYGYPTYFNSYDNNNFYHGVRENHDQRIPSGLVNTNQQSTKKPNRFNTDLEFKKPLSRPSLVDFYQSKKPLAKPYQMSTRPYRQGNTESNEGNRDSDKPSKVNQNHSRPSSNYNRPSSNHNRPSERNNRSKNNRPR